MLRFGQATAEWCRITAVGTLPAKECKDVACLVKWEVLPLNHERGDGSVTFLPA